MFTETVDHVDPDSLGRQRGKIIPRPDVGLKQVSQQREFTMARVGASSGTVFNSGHGLSEQNAQSMRAFCHTSGIFAEQQVKTGLVPTRRVDDHTPIDNLQSMRGVRNRSRSPLCCARLTLPDKHIRAGPAALLVLCERLHISTSEATHHSREIHYPGERSNQRETTSDHA
ncbi:hypothetical protein PUN4_230047 [Paraburkholderia unamae]|nr:hypothetical protein PUN4_230047 [Paraburkholderia unamae]